MSIDDIALTFVPGLGTKGVVHLLETFATAEAVFAASVEDLCEQAGLRADVAHAVVAKRGHAAAEQEWRYCQHHDLTAVASTDTDYPALLREIPDYPHILYIRGNADALTARMVAVVGTRKMTTYGQHNCNALIAGIAEQLPETVIVSGLAYGIDSAAHRAALAHGCRTVGVVANPLPDVTPAAHEMLAREMIDKGGAVVSELSSQTHLNGSYFVPRNRLVAGMAAGTVVVESDLGGGALTTAQFADGYNRSVMAVPGRTTDAASRGTNALIRNRKAQMVTSAEDVLRELEWELGLGEQHRREQTFALTPLQEGLLGCFRTADAVALDELAAQATMPTGEVSALLLEMELAGVVRQLPGQRYEKLI